LDEDDFEGDDFILVFLVVEAEEEGVGAVCVGSFASELEGADAIEGGFANEAGAGASGADAAAAAAAAAALRVP